VFAISSTVAPGSTEQVFIPLLEKYSGRRVGVDFGVCYDPDFVALGDVVRGFLRPELIVLGETEPRAGDIVQAIHERICENKPVVSRMSIASAELAKVALNTYITLKISFANNLANLCEQIPGTNVDVITKAIGVDRRISPFYFRGGLSFGGTCFPRDTRAFIHVSQQFGVMTDLIDAVEKINRFQDEHLLEVTLQELSACGTKSVSILGLSFKVDTPVITESPGIKLVSELVKRDIEIVVYDPLAILNARTLFNDSIGYVSSAAECISRGRVCVVTTTSAEFKAAAESYHEELPLTLIDCWRLVDSSKLAPIVKYVPWGHPITNTFHRELSTSLATNLNR
jgi:UDPglucose 6-dehydrogenase